MNLICILHIVYSYIFLMFLKIKNIIKTLNYLYNLTWARHSLISTGILLEWFSQVRVLACDSPGRHSNEHWLHELQVLHDIPDRGFLTSKKIIGKNYNKDYGTTIISLYRRKRFSTWVSYAQTMADFETFLPLFSVKWS